MFGCVEGEVSHTYKTQPGWNNFLQRRERESIQQRMSNNTVSVQLCRKKQAFIVTVSARSSALDLKTKLLEMISAVGGLRNGESKQEDESEDDIPIPVPTYGDDDDSEEEGNAATSTSVKIHGEVPRLGDLVIGEPKDPSNVYGGGFKDIQDEKAQLDLKQFGIFAFRLYDEKFQVQRSTVDNH